MARKKTERSIIIGGRIREARIDAGLNNSQLARLTDISRGSIIRLIRGDNEPEQATLERIAAATGKPLDFFRVDDVPLSDTIYAQLQRSLRDVIDHQLAQRLEPLQDAVESLRQLGDENLSDALAYVYGRVLIAVDLWKQDEREEAVEQLRQAEHRLADAIAVAREAA